MLYDSKKITEAAEIILSDKYKENALI
jgi:hypothetical protein